MSLFTDLIQDPTATKIYVLVIKPYDLNTDTVVTEYYSTHAFTSAPSDSPANTYFQPILENALLFSRSLFESGRLGGRSSSNNGTINLNNSEGIIDSWAHYSFAGREIEVLCGGDGFTFADFGTIFKGTCSSVSFSDTEVSIQLRDFQELLNVPISRNYYGGTGGWDGGDDLKGKPKPLVYGYCQNIQAFIVDAQNLRYQIHDGPVDEINVFDSGVQLTYYSNYLTVADLDAATIPAGNFASSVENGIFKLGSSPAGEVTVDVRGDNTGNDYVESAPQVLERILTTRFGYTLADYSSDSILSLHNANPDSIGYFVSDTVTASEALDSIINSIGAYYFFDREGILSVGRIEVPEVTSVYTFDETQIQIFEKEAVQTPVWRLSLDYAKNWTVMTGTSVAGAVPPAKVSFLSQEFRNVFQYDVNILTKHILATDAVYESLLTDIAPAQNECNRQFNLYSVQREMYKITVATQPLSLNLGQTVTLKYPRYGLSSGKNFVIIGMTEDSSLDLITLELWG